jgi:2-keto-4-pentenoate hydratase
MLRVRSRNEEQPDAIRRAASILWRSATNAERIPFLPPDIRPSTRADGYAIQSELTSLFQQPVVGWKIAATSIAGQQHIGVDGPLVGSLMLDRMLPSGARVSLSGNHMRVGEAEFAFRFARDLTPRGRPYDVGEVLDAVGDLHPTIEIPDSRFDDFARVGAPQLIADNACASWLVVGTAVSSWRGLDLVAHIVEGFLDDERVVTGTGANVLDDPREALTWMVNERCTFGSGVRAGDLVTTGTCIAPVTIAPGQHFRADFGVLGSLVVHLE